VSVELAPLVWMKCDAVFNSMIMHCFPTGPLLYSVDKTDPLRSELKLGTEESGLQPDQLEGE